MKKFLATLLSVAMLLGITMPAYAADLGNPNVDVTASGVSPRAMIDYQSHWHAEGTDRYGEFNVSGNGGRSVKMTVAIANFGSSNYIEVAVYGGNGGPLLTSVTSWNGTGLSPSNPEFVFPRTFSGYDTYTIKWRVFGPDDSGRIMCWVYN